MRTLLRIFALALMLPLAGCSDSTSPEPGIEGVYTLRTINGGTLPWLAVNSGGTRVDVISGSITLLTDGTFTDKTTFKVVEQGVERLEDDVYTGTFVKTGIGATLNPVGFQPYIVSISGASMTQLIGEATLVYRK